MNMHGKASQPQNQSGGATVRPFLIDPYPGAFQPARQPIALRGSITDRQFRDETSDEVAAERWFIDIFWQSDHLPRCPR